MKLLLITVAVTFLAGCSGVAKEGEVRYAYTNDSSGIVCKTTQYEPIPVENIDTYDSDEITYYGDTFIHDRRIDTYDSDDITYYGESTDDPLKCSS